MTLFVCVRCVFDGLYRVFTAGEDGRWVSGLEGVLHESEGKELYKDESYLVQADMLYNLSDAEEHIAELIQEMTTDSEFSDIEFSIGLSHIYSHLNRAWNARNATNEQVSDPGYDNPVRDMYEGWSRFPTDLEPS